MSDIFSTSRSSDTPPNLGGSPDYLAGSKKSPVSDPIAEAQARNKDREDARVEYDKKTQERLDQLRANSSTAKGGVAQRLQKVEDIKPPEMSDLPPPPVMKDTDPVNVWGSLAMLAAALGGARSHTPAITALNAAAEVMKGFHDRDKEKYDQSFDRWKVANDNLLKSMTYQVNIYKALLSGGLGAARVGIAQENADTRVDVADLAAQSRSFGNKRLTEMLEMHDLEGARKMVEDMEKTKMKLEESAGKVGESHDLTDALETLHSSPDYLGATPYQKLKMDIDVLQTVAPTLNERGNGSQKDRVLSGQVYDREFKDPATGQKRTDAPAYDVWYKDKESGWSSPKFDSPLAKPKEQALAGQVVQLPDGSHTKLKEGGKPESPDDWQPVQLKAGGNPKNDADWEPVHKPASWWQRLLGGGTAAAGEGKPGGIVIDPKTSEPQLVPGQ